MKRKKIIEIGLHLLFWSIPILITGLVSDTIYFNQFSALDNSLFYATLYSTVFHAAMFYSCVWYILKRHRKSQAVTFFLCFLSYIIFTSIESIVDVIICNHFLFQGNKNSGFLSYLAVNLIFHIFFIVLAYAYGTIRLKLIVEKNEQKLKIEKLNAELNFLKMQTNPHFLFNTLNNLYGLARKEKATATSEGITKLSKMMRYITYDSNTDSVPLEKEIENILIYIELQKLRFSKEDDITITMESKSDFSNHKIAPMLLITLVENAFKHGIDIDKKSFIHIKISLINNELDFYIQNTIHKKQSNNLEEYSGIGLQNIRKRLDLIYYGHYNLDFKEDKGIFTANLVLKI